jgi:hypothetical protein
LAITVVLASAALGQQLNEQAPQDPFRNLTVSEFSSGANPYQANPNQAYVWGCAFHSGWNLDLLQNSGVNFAPEVGAMQQAAGHYSYIVEVIDSTHWLADTVDKATNGTPVWREQTVTLEDPITGEIRITGDVTPEYLFGITHPPTPVHAYVTKASNSVAVTGGKLEAGQSLTSPSGNTVLTMQTDGNLVLSYKTGGKFNAIWSTGTAGNPGSEMELLPGGNVIVNSPKNNAIWSTSTPGWGPVDMSVQDNGNVLLTNFYDRAIWSTGTIQPTP